VTTLLPRKGVEFRVWAPKRKRVDVVLGGQSTELTRESDGYFSGVVAAAGAGSRYKFKLDDDANLYPDPQSRFQPGGPHGESQVVDPSFPWTDHDWRGLEPQGQIIYELHLGTFTPEGTWNAAQAQLPELASIGITTVEVMPINEFSGRWGWGYDGVDLYAPSHLYGSPDDARHFVDHAHSLGLGVILDVVYNHLGPDGNYLKAFADEYFTDEYETDWGEAINFSSEPVREFYLANAAYWIGEFHFDGLRLDATQDIHDLSEEHILAALTRRARAAAGVRKIYIVAENEPQHSDMALPVEEGGYGLDALWNDDFHHSALVAVTGHNEAYYTDYHGSPQEFVSAAKYGYLYQGQFYKWQKKRRGRPAFELNPWSFVTYFQNHDQIANSARGERLNVIADPGSWRALSALLMLLPSTPMLFQGQEFGATAPFVFFCDHGSDLCDKVREGRAKFLAQFPAVAQPEVQAQLTDPNARGAFEKSKLDFSERLRNEPTYLLYKDLIRLRKDDPVFNSADAVHFDGAVLSERAFVLRYFSADHGDRLLVVNFGRDLHLSPAPEPLLAPPWHSQQAGWTLLWSSEHPKYGGSGTVPPDTEKNWCVAGHSAIVLTGGERAEIP
jgi:maltooligosyltrehalose trehalohydrolase